LKNPAVSKIVLIGHSQGAIIVSNVLSKLKDKNYTREELNKLEVYTFASPASKTPFRTYRIIY